MKKESGIKPAVKHFKTFHKGWINIIAHIIGFGLTIYSVIRADWLLFAISIIILESGHFYNHFAGIKKYDFRPRIIIWRIIVFAIVVILFYILAKYLL
jgi:hypothetical protein